MACKRSGVRIPIAPQCDLSGHRNIPGPALGSGVRFCVRRSGWAAGGLVVAVRVEGEFAEKLAVAASMTRATVLLTSVRSRPTAAPSCRPATAQCCGQWTPTPTRSLPGSPSSVQRTCTPDRRSCMRDTASHGRGRSRSGGGSVVVIGQQRFDDVLIWLVGAHRLNPDSVTAGADTLTYDPSAAASSAAPARLPLGEAISPTDQ